jgi:hypothetical protein
MATTKVNKVPIEFTLDTGNAIAKYFINAFDSLSVYGIVLRVAPHFDSAVCRIQKAWVGNGKGDRRNETTT